MVTYDSTDVRRKGIAREILAGIESVISSDKSQHFFEISPRGRDFFGEDSAHFVYDSGKYKLRFVREDDRIHRFTITLFDPRIGAGDIVKRLGYLIKECPAERVNLGEPSHDGQNFVIPFGMPSEYSSIKMAHVILYLVQYLRGARPVLEKKEEEEKKKGEEKRKRNTGKFAPNGPSKF